MHKVYKASYNVLFVGCLALLLRAVCALYWSLYWDCIGTTVLGRFYVLSLPVSVPFINLVALFRVCLSREMGDKVTTLLFSCACIYIYIYICIYIYIYIYIDQCKKKGSVF